MCDRADETRAARARPARPTSAVTPKLDLPLVIGRRGVLLSWSVPLLALVVGTSILSRPVVESRTATARATGDEVVAVRIEESDCSQHWEGQRSSLRFVATEPMRGEIIQIIPDENRRLREPTGCEIRVRVSPASATLVQASADGDGRVYVELRTTRPSALRLLLGTGTAGLPSAAPE